MLTNPRHLETFYYIVQHGGINRAVGRMPYGIQQPAISEQIHQLEESFGYKLFVRNPFRLTAEGSAIYAHVEPFFGGLPDLTRRLRGGLDSNLRIGAEEILIQHLLPAVIGTTLQHNSKLRYTFRAGCGLELSRQLRNHEVDLVLTTQAGVAPPGVVSMPLLQVPLTLIVDKSTTIDSAAQFWTGRNITHALVCPSASDEICQVFRRGLKQGSIHWPTTLVAASVSSVAAFVLGGLSVGVSLDLPCLTGNPNLRVLPLPGFDPVQITALWRHENTQQLKQLVTMIKLHARKLSEFAALQIASTPPRQRRRVGTRFETSPSS